MRREVPITWRKTTVLCVSLLVAAGVPFTSHAVGPECNTGIGHASRFKFTNLVPGTVYELSNGTRILAIGTIDCVRWIVVEKSNVLAPNKPNNVILSEKTK